MSYKYSGLIKCLRCGSNFRGKMQRSKKVYVCLTYSKDSSKCVRHTIKEEDINNNITKHVEIFQHKIITDGQEEYVQKIEVGEKGFKIYYNDNTPESIVEFDRARY